MWKKNDRGQVQALPYLGASSFLPIHHPPSAAATAAAQRGTDAQVTQINTTTSSDNGVSSVKQPLSLA
jgi:hypothetical protein